MTALERMARALFDRLYSDGDTDVDTMWTRSKREFIDDARAALLAIREPTEAMVKAAVQEAACYAQHCSCRFNLAWPIMIDSILSETPEGK